MEKLIITFLLIVITISIIFSLTTKQDNQAKLFKEFSKEANGKYLLGQKNFSLKLSSGEVIFVKHLVIKDVVKLGKDLEEYIKKILKSINPLPLDIMENIMTTLRLGLTMNPHTKARLLR